MTERRANLISIFKTAGVLILIAVIAAGLLGVVNHFTQIDDDEVFVKKINELYECEAGFENLIDIIDYDRVKDHDILKKSALLRIYKPLDDTHTFIMVCRGNGAYKSTLEIMMVISEEYIEEIISYKNGETPGLGSKVFEESYLKQYKGVDVESFERFAFAESGKGSVQVLSGATKTSTAVLNAVNCGVLFYKTFAGDVFAPGDGA